MYMVGVDNSWQVLVHFDGTQDVVVKDLAVLTRRVK